MDNTQSVLLKRMPVIAKIINVIIWLNMPFNFIASGAPFFYPRARARCVFLFKFFILALGLPGHVSASEVGSATGTYYQGDGVVWSYNDLTTRRGSTQSALNCETNNTGGVLVSRGRYNWGSAGGYYGIQLAPDIILSLQGSAHFDGKSSMREYLRLKWYFYYNSPPATNGSYYYSTGSQVIDRFENYEANSGDAYFRAYPSLPHKHSIMTIYSETKIAMQLYVGPNATPGTYYLPTLSFQYGCGNNNTPVLAPSTITVKKRELACSISPPNVIDFGSIAIRGRSDGEVLGVRNGHLNVSCNDQGHSRATGTVSVTGEKGRYTNTLKMGLSGASGDAPAEIRGFIGPSIPQTGICDGNANHTGWIQFTNAAQHISIGTLKTGNNSIPYSFSLCATGAKNGGKASATATINLFWD